MNENTEIEQVDGSTLAEGLVTGLVYTLGYIILALVTAGLLAEVKIFQSLAIVIGGSTLFIGLAQLIYVVPLCISCRRNGKMAKLKGHIVWASVVLLLNGTCWASMGNFFR